jgi:uncharacterized membrane protein
MRKHRVILGVVLLVLTLGTSGPQFAQNASTAEKSNQPSHDRVFVLGLLSQYGRTGSAPGRPALCRK